MTTLIPEAAPTVVTTVGSEPAPAPNTITRRELVVVAAALAVLFALPLLVPALRVLVTKPLWLDEFHTWLLARDAPGPQLLFRLGRGADFNPPLLFVIDHLMLRLLPFAPPQLVLRLTSVISIWLACVLIYRMLRQWLEPVPCAVGVIATMSHPALLGQLHEARFYSPWLLLTVLLAWSMQGLMERPESWPRRLQLVVVTAATCLIHYFGVLSIACLALGFLLTVRSVARARPVALWMAVGMLSFVAWLRVYARQRHVLSLSTWVDPPSIGYAVTYLYRYLAWPPLVVLLVTVAVFGTIARRKSRDGFLSVAQGTTLGLLALPLVVILFSFVVQPSLVARYSLPVVAALACVVAFATARLPQRIQPLLLPTFVALHVWALVEQTGPARRFYRETADDVAATNDVAPDARPVLVPERFLLYPAALSEVSRNPRLVYLDLPSDTIRSWVARRPALAASSASAALLIVERDLARAHRDLFGFPVMMPLASMRKVPSFYVLADTVIAPIFPDLFAGYRACRANARLLLFTASPGTLPSEHALDDSPRCAVARAGRVTAR